MEPGTGDTPLMIACRRGDALGVRICLQHGAKNDPHPEFGQTALHAGVDAMQIDGVRVLLEAAAQVCARLIIASSPFAEAEMACEYLLYLFLFLLLLLLLLLCIT